MAHPLRAPLSRIILFLSLALPLLGAGPVQGQQAPTRWQPLGGPAGRLIHLAAGPNGRDLVAVSAVASPRKPDQTQWRDTGVLTPSNALYGSRDAGATWQALTNDLPPGAITALYVDHRGHIWLGLQMRAELPGRRNGLWHSEDHGTTWREQPLERDDLIIVTIAEDAAQQLLFGAVDDGGFEQGWVYRATANGAPWRGTQLSTASANDRLTRVITDPDTAGAQLAVLASGALLVTRDGGESWQPAQGASGGGTSQLAFLPGQPGAVILVQSSATPLRVLKSTDDGATWSEVRASGLPDAPLGIRSMLALGRGVLLLNTAAGTYRSADGGTRWQPLEGVLSSGSVNAWTALSSTTVLAATDYGLYESTDAGAVWRAYGSGLPNNSAVRVLLTHKDRPTLIAASLAAPDDADPPELLLTRDGARTWLPADLGGAWTDPTASAIDPGNPDTFYLAGPDYVATSTDGGFSWNVRPLAFPVVATRQPIVVAPSDSSTVYIGGSACLRSTDAGRTWTELPSGPDTGCGQATALAVAPTVASHVWSGANDGVRESQDGGRSWQRAGLEGQSIQWLAASGGGRDQGPLTLYAGLAEGGIAQRRGTSEWEALAAGLPAKSVITAFVADPRTPGLLWAARDGGGVYRSTDGGATWANIAVNLGDNLVLALAVNYAAPQSILAGTASAGLWALDAAGPTPGPTGAPAADSEGSASTDARGRTGVDARIEVVWPHDFASINDARLANIGIRLFVPRSLQPPSCGWRPKVQVWRAVDNEPAELAETAEQRTVDGQPFPYWDANDVDISPARDAAHKIYFMVSVEGVDTASSVWAHASDARTNFPEQEVPSGVATGSVDAVDARIQIVWPHDREGAEARVEQADLANVAVTLFKHGTRLSVPASWTGPVRLYGAWNAEVGRRLNVEPVLSNRQAGVITYPVWEFNDVPVDRARDAVHRLYLWAVAEDVKSYPAVWAHGADSRTFFPATDEPIQGCAP